MNYNSENIKTSEFLFHQGTYFKAYEFMGAHKENGETVFRTWAPSADAIYVTGDFNGWDESLPMVKLTEKGIWEARLKLDFRNEDRLKYKFKIINGNRAIYKADPYAFFSGTHAETSSILYDLPEYAWEDGDFLAARKKAMCPDDGKAPYSTPINIYEVHLGSFKRHPDGSYLSYRELADELAPYVKRMGYTHIELMPLSEHPLDESWGYQVCGFYAPTSRFGEPADLMYFVNKLHSYGIGVIMDWVPAHFSKDAHGLCEFDGSLCYEYQGADRMEHKVWGTRFFDVGREEVQSFLVSNALYWLSEYHFDGLRVDAVASMLYLDFDRAPGEWTPAYDGSNRNYEAIAFFKKLNTAIFEKYDDVIMAAEESSDWPMLTKPVYAGGIGFNFKWNMGFMNDTLRYSGIDPLFRRYEHKLLNFSLMYAYNENYILSLSHDEVVHCKGSLINKMFGSYDQKFDGLRTYLTFFMCHPGKKLLFMGCEYAQFAEWNCTAPLEWEMLRFYKHEDMRNFTAALNHFYLGSPQLWEQDLSPSGFEWINADDADDNFISFLRYAADGTFILCTFNFSAKELDIGVGVPLPGAYTEVFSTHPSNKKPIAAEKRECDGRDHSIRVSMPPLSASIYKYEPIKPIK